MIYIFCASNTFSTRETWQAMDIAWMKNSTSPPPHPLTMSKTYLYVCSFTLIMTASVSIWPSDRLKFGQGHCLDRTLDSSLHFESLYT